MRRRWSDQRCGLRCIGRRSKRADSVSCCAVREFEVTAAWRCSCRLKKIYSGVRSIDDAREAGCARGFSVLLWCRSRARCPTAFLFGNRNAGRSAAVPRLQQNRRESVLSSEPLLILTFAYARPLSSFGTNLIIPTMKSSSPAREVNARYVASRHCRGSRARIPYALCHGIIKSRCARKNVDKIVDGIKDGGSAPRRTPKHVRSLVNCP